MSKIIATSAIRGAHAIYGMAEEKFQEARAAKGGAQKISFPETAFYLPAAYALLGLEVRTLDDAERVLKEAKALLPEIPSPELWLPYLGDALDAGTATLLSEEVLMALRYLSGEEPQPGCNGFFTDTILRTLGIMLVDGRMPGFAAILGAAPNPETAVKIVRELQKKNILIFAGSQTGGVSVIDQLKEGGVEMGWDTYIVPFGRDTVSAIYPLNWALRAALTFGGLKKGQVKECLLYCKERVNAFVIALGEVDDYKFATAAGAITMGFPVIADTAIPEILESGLTVHEAVIVERDYDKIVPRAIIVRGIKIKVKEIPLPVPYAAAFEGERVRKEDLQVQSGSKYSKAFEYLLQGDLEKLSDGRITLHGPDIDTVAEGGSLPLGIVVRVAGRKMEKDFESILERQIHSFINGAMGVMHIGQREMVWLRISKKAFASGFRLRHLGEIVVARLHNDFGAIVDKAEVAIFTLTQDVEREMETAKVSYAARDARVAGMTDESVATFYSCTLCQSFAPSHVCIISPERLGLCGAYNWLDGKAAHEINPRGPNQPVAKGKTIDLGIGQWESINAFVDEASHRALKRF
ncbi:MAG: CO dehydrogenase/CO-methylating acetyl-CoA synthase complex subunit beta, partial [Candidatus Aureabacteria bacterium]|nr:CO dehydrogenase/CO-methylating acetyl-CoA synthase complex subunit beta [Candidatus Auribacterota bacterium]